MPRSWDQLSESNVANAAVEAATAILFKAIFMGFLIAGCRPLGTMTLLTAPDKRVGDRLPPRHAIEGGHVSNFKSALDVERAATAVNILEGHAPLGGWLRGDTRGPWQKKQGATGITTVAPYIAGQWGRGE
jgi:hypothetical protein